MTVTQDGDDEGCLRLFHLPSPPEAVVIRDVMGLRKRVAYAPETLDRKRASMARAGLARGAARASIADDDMPPRIGGHLSPDRGLAVEREAILDGEEEPA